MIHHLTRALDGAPAWSIVLAAAALALTVLAVAFVAVRALWRSRARDVAARRAQQRELGRQVRSVMADAGPLAVLGICGMVVSLHGLLGFATQTMQLPLLFAVPFVALFDVAEALCFISLYRSAGEAKKWTRPMRRTRRMAWMLVALSSLFNAVHAPGNIYAKVAFAIVPPLAARFVEHELDKKLCANAGADDERPPGPVLLVQLGYRHMWARVFARLHLDPAEAADDRVPQQARIRLAAAALSRLGGALDRQDKLPEDARPRERNRAKAEVQALTARAKGAVDAAGVATDTAAMLDLARHLATGGRVGELARINPREPKRFMTLMEELAIVPSAEAILAGAKATEAQEAAAKAEEARAAAEADLQRIQRDAAQAQKTAKDAQAQQTEAERERERIANEAEDARRQLAELQEEAKAAHQLLSTAQKAAKDAQDNATHLRDSVEATEGEKARAERAVRDAHQQVRDASTTLSNLQHKAEKASADASAAIEAKRKAEEAQRSANAAVEDARRQIKELRNQAAEAAQHRDNAASELRRLVAEQKQAAQDLQDERRKAEEARQEAHALAEERQAAAVALQHAKDELLDALTSPTAYEPPRWTSPAKVRGWELYQLHVRAHGIEPSDDQLAAECDRDPSTVRKWLGEFRTELARLTAHALTTQTDAHDRTADETQQRGSAASRTLAGAGVAHPRTEPQTPALV